MGNTCCSLESSPTTGHDRNRANVNTDGNYLQRPMSISMTPRSDGANNLSRLISSDSTSSVGELDDTQKDFINSVFNHTSTNADNSFVSTVYDTRNNKPKEGESEMQETHETAETTTAPVATMATAESRRDTTARTINENIVNGWKHAIESGNDSLCLTMYGDYREYNQEFINVIFENGDNSLHVACRGESHKLVYFLLNHCKMNVNSINSINGRTPLHYACLRRDDHLVALLLFKFYGNPSIADNKGKLPIDIATSRQYKCSKIESLITRAVNGNVRKTRYRSDARDTRDARDGRRRLSDSESRYDDDDDTSSSNSSSSNYGRNINSIIINNGNKSTVIDNSSSSGSGHFLTESKEMQLSQLTKRNPFRNPYRKGNVEYKITVAEKRDPIARGNKIFWKKKNELPQLNGWLKKRRPRKPFRWQKRWVVIADDHMLWSDKQIDVPNNHVNNTHNQNDSDSESDSDNEETENINSNNNNNNNSNNAFAPVMSIKDRKEFNSNVKFNNIEEISISMENEKNKYKEICFIIKARSKKNHDGTLREYMWKCANKKERDEWVKGLKQHINFYKQAQKYDIL